MATYTINEEFDITHSAADREGYGYVCDAIVVRRIDNSIAGRHRGDGRTATAAENAAVAKAKAAIANITLETLTLSPCPKCGEREKLSTELHPGTAFVRCDVCQYRGPEFVPPHEKDRERELLVAVVRGWNNVAR